MTIEEAFFILKHGSAEGLHKYLEAIRAIEQENKRLNDEARLIDINAAKVQKEYEKEISELKRLLKLAVEDIRRLLVCSCVSTICSEKACNCSTVAQCKCICNWKHANEAMKLIGGNEEEN